jgi:hypothetical protein
MRTDKKLPMDDLKIFGIYRDGKFTIPEEQIKALKDGRMTDIVELKNLKGKDIEIETLPARLSIVRGDNGNPSLRIDPVYREPNEHPQLSQDERQRLIKAEIANIKKSYVDKEGNVQTEIIEYDKETKQFMAYNPRKVKAPETVNEQHLTPEQKRKYKEAEVVELNDGTAFQFTGIDKKGIKSNRSGLVLSVILDGGISYLLYTGLKRMLGAKSNEEKSYSQGYVDGINKVQKQIERRISRFPEDRDAIRDMNNVKQELSKVSAAHPKEFQNRDYDDVKRLNSIDTEEGRDINKHREKDDGRQRRI